MPGGVVIVKGSKEQLYEYIADLLEMPHGTVKPSTSVAALAARSSLQTAIMLSAFHSRFDIEPDFKVMNTVEDIEKLFDPASAEAMSASESVQSKLFGMDSEHSGAGTDIEKIENLPKVDDYWEDSFYRDTFTPSEIAYCVSQANPRSHFAARWAAKEALFKARNDLNSYSLNQVRITKQPGGAVAAFVQQGHSWRPLDIELSISHTDEHAQAFALAK